MIVVREQIDVNLTVSKSYHEAALIFNTYDKKNIPP